MGWLRDRMKQDLELRGSCPNTVLAYLRCARTFAAHFKRSPAAMGATEVREFLLYLVEKRKVSPSTFNVYSAALTFLYRVTLGRAAEMPALPRMKVPRAPRRLPASSGCASRAGAERSSVEARRSSSAGPSGAAMKSVAAPTTLPAQGNLSEWSSVTGLVFCCRDASIRSRWSARPSSLRWCRSLASRCAPRRHASSSQYA